MIIIFAFSSQSQKEKFEYLYHTYKNLLLYKAHEILKDYALAEDAVSEAWIRIYKNIDKIDDPTSNSSVAFVVTIVKNTALTLLSKEKKQEHTALPDDQTNPFDLEHYILGEISAEEIIGIVDTLNEDLKSVFILSYAHQLSHKEIGRLLNISEKNVTVRLHRGKRKLAELLLKGGYAHERA